jgi:hypothetical protein
MVKIANTSKGDATVRYSERVNFNVPSNIARLQFSGFFDNSSYYFQTVKRFTYFPKDSTTDEAIAKVIL